jgi:hypothetical protein
MCIRGNRRKKLASIARMTKTIRPAVHKNRQATIT